MILSKRTVLPVCIAALIALAGCRAEEQGRIKDFDPGVYKGAEDQELSEDTLNTLRGRASQQRMQ